MVYASRPHNSNGDKVCCETEALSHTAKKYYSRATFFTAVFLAAAHCSPWRASGISVFRLATMCIVDVLFIGAPRIERVRMQFMNSQLILSHDMHECIIQRRHSSGMHQAPHIDPHFINFIVKLFPSIETSRQVEGGKFIPIALFMIYMKRFAALKCTMHDHEVDALLNLKYADLLLKLVILRN
jgi:hypothetical protein